MLKKPSRGRWQEREGELDEKLGFITALFTEQFLYFNTRKQARILL